MKISRQQLFWIIVMLNMGINLLITISISIAIAHQDVWMSYVLTGVAGLVAVYLGVKLSLRHPGQTLIQFSSTILGKWLGKLIVIPYLFQWTIVIPLVLRDQYRFMHMNVLYKTPAWMILASMLVVIVYTVYHGGLEAIARCTQIWSPILVAILFLTFVLTMNNLDWKAILPVYALTGPMRILEGALPSTSLIAEVISVTMLVPFVEKPEKGLKRAAFLGVIFSSSFILLGALWVVMTFGWHVSSRLEYPFFEMVKLVYLMEFIQNMDIFVMAVWLISIFVKMSLYTFIVSYAFSQWIGKTKHWRKMIWISAVLTFIICIVLIQKGPSNTFILNHIWIQILLPLNSFLIPLLLLVVSFIRFPGGGTKKLPQN